ncbi:MAG: RNA polymerase sigma-70 factor [Bacteroidetes bacterium]|nr:RNA polymerase sigma-70 factor [Bacteroidota bacterium]
MLSLEEQFKRIYYQHFEALCRFAEFYCKDSDEASSVVQQVFLNLWERREELLKGDDLRAYLFTAVRNRVFTSVRRKKITEELDAVAELPADHQSTRIEIRELQEQIRSAIQSLPERCRYIFEMSRFENMTYQQIADRLDLSVKTVENQISKALKILRKRILSSDNQTSEN